MKKSLFLLLALTLILSATCFALPSAVDAGDTAVQTAVQTQEIAHPLLDGNGVTTVHPISNEKTYRQPMAALSDSIDYDNSIVVWSIDVENSFLSEKTFNVYVSLYSNVFDAKYKLAVSVVDSNGGVVATQTKCEYDIYYGGGLKYTMSVSNGFKHDYNEQYSVKLTYNGTYPYYDESYGADVYFSEYPSIIGAEIVNDAQKTMKFYIANFDSTAKYVIATEDYTYYTPYKTESNAIYIDLADDFTFTEENFGNNKTLFILCEEYKDTPGAYNEYYYYYYRTFNLAEIYEPDYVSGILSYDTLPASIKSFSVNIYSKHNYMGEYTQAEANKVKAYMVDAASGTKIADASISFYSYGDGYGEIDATFNVQNKLTAGRKYCLIVDDGSTVRIVKTVATDEFWFDGVGLKAYGSNTYSSYEFDIMNKYDGRIFEMHNASDLTKIDINIYNSQGEKIVTLDKGSVKLTNASSGTYSFTMTRQLEIDKDEWYYIELSYDGVIYFSNTIYVRDDNSGGGSYVSDFYMNCSDAVIQPDGTAYLMVLVETDTYTHSNLKYVIIDNQTGYSYNAAYQELYCTPYDNVTVFLLKAQTQIDLENNIDLSLEARENNYNQELIDSVYYVPTRKGSAPFLFDQMFEQNGYYCFYGYGLSDSKTYKLTGYNEVTGKEFSIPITKTAGKNELKISIASLNNIWVESGYFYVEQNDDIILAVDAYDITDGFSPNEYFYAVYKNIAHRTAVLGLPYGKYTQYRVANSLSELNSKAYSAIKPQIAYTLPSGDGKKIIYAQFKTANGTVSEVMTTIVYVDTTPPVINEVKRLRDVYVIGSDGKFRLEIAVDATESGYVWYYFEDAQGQPIGAEESFYHDINDSPDSYFVRTYNSKYYDYEKAERFVVYMEDDCNNFTEYKYFDVSVVQMYSQYDLESGGYILFNNQTRLIEQVNTSAQSVVLPAKINGVNVIGIADDAFLNSTGVKEITVPKSYDTIEDSAFYGLTGVKLLVRENSTAHYFAQNNGVDFEFVVAATGDLNDDSEVTIDDAILLFQHTMMPDVYDIKVPGSVDFNGDGAVDIYDAILLFQHSMMPDVYPLN